MVKISRLPSVRPAARVRKPQAMSCKEKQGKRGVISFNICSANNSLCSPYGAPPVAVDLGCVTFFGQ